MLRVFPFPAGISERRQDDAVERVGLPDLFTKQQRLEVTRTRRLPPAAREDRRLAQANWSSVGSHSVHAWAVGTLDLVTRILTVTSIGFSGLVAQRHIVSSDVECIDGRERPAADLSPSTSQTRCSSRRGPPGRSGSITRPSRSPVCRRGGPSRLRRGRSTVGPAGGG